MGLDTSHDCWHGPYSSFNRWRNCVAAAAGYTVQPAQYDDGLKHDMVVLDWEGIHGANPGCYQGEWRQQQDDALMYLIVHSDCDGVLMPEHAAPLADRLEAILPKVAEGCGHHEFDRHADKTRQFIAGLRAAAAVGEPVDFH